MAFQAYSRTLVTVNALKYLGRVLAAYYNYWPAVVANFYKAQSKWASFSRIWGQEGSDPQTSVIFYKAIFQANILFGSETWVMTLSIGHNLGVFHHRVARRLS